MLSTVPKIFVIGAYGQIGRLLIREILNECHANIVIAGLCEDKASNLTLELSREYRRVVCEYCQFDVKKQEDFEKITVSEASMVINCAGPFGDYDYSLPRFCAEYGLVYMDTALDRNYICDIYQLDELAKQHQAVIISGCGLLPSLTTTIIDEMGKKFDNIEKIEIAFHAESKNGLGSATVRTLLAKLGKPYTCIEHGKVAQQYVGQKIHRRYFGDSFGYKWQSNFDAPELGLIPKRFPGLNTMSAYIGTTPKYVDWFFWMMSWFVRWNILSTWRKLPTFIFDKVLANKYGKGGREALVVRLTGTGETIQPLKVVWSLIAEKGEGCYLSAITAGIIARKVINTKFHYGAYPCINLFTLQEFIDQLDGRAVYYLKDEFHD